MAELWIQISGVIEIMSLFISFFFVIAKTYKSNLTDKVFLEGNISSKAEAWKCQKYLVQATESFQSWSWLYSIPQPISLVTKSENIFVIISSIFRLRTSDWPKLYRLNKGIWLDWRKQLCSFIREEQHCYHWLSWRLVAK